MKSVWLFSLRLWSRLPSNDSGQSVIETAVMLPVLFLMIFGFINFCLLIFCMGNANFASRAALRYASTHSSTSYFPAKHQDLINVVAPFIYSYPVNTYSISETYTTTGTTIGTNTVGSEILLTLTVKYNFNVLGYSFAPITYSSTGCGIVVQ